MKTLVTVAFVTVALLFSLSAGLYAQDETPQLLEILYADSLVGSEQSSVELREFVGNVRMRQGKVNMTCNRAIQHITEQYVELIGNVVITQDTLTLKTPRGLYYSNRKHATTSDGIHLNDGHVTLTSRIGAYNTSTKIAEFSKDVRVVEPDAAIRSDHLVYVRDSSKATADGNVSIRFTGENAVIQSDSAIHYIKRKQSYFFSNPVLWQVDSSYSDSDSLRLDTLSIVAEYMEADRDTANVFYARDSVEIVRGAFAARAPEVMYFRSDSVVILRPSPTLWFDENQVRGDSVVVGLAGGTIETLQIYGAAVSVSQSKATESDTLAPPGRYNQTTGKDITFFFADDKLAKILVEGSATSLYFLYEEQALNGVRKESGDSIIITFEEGKARYIRTLNGVEGTYYPERFVTGNPESYNLRGFFWEDERPLQPLMPAGNAANPTPAEADTE